MFIESSIHYIDWKYFFDNMAPVCLVMFNNIKVHFQKLSTTNVGKKMEDSENNLNTCPLKTADDLLMLKSSVSSEGIILIYVYELS